MSDLAIFTHIEIDSHGRGTNILGNVDDLLESWHSERHVLGRNSGLNGADNYVEPNNMHTQTYIVEGVEGHLGCRLAETLRC